MTALAYVTITGAWSDGSGSGDTVSGSVVFTPTATVYAAGQPLVIAEVPVQALIADGQLQALDGSPLQLLATDNAGLSVEGPDPAWLWCVKVEVTAGGGTAEDSWEFELPSSPDTVDLYGTRNPA
jgi:hypothetical protein